MGFVTKSGLEDMAQCFFLIYIVNNRIKGLNLLWKLEISLFMVLNKLSCEICFRLIFDKLKLILCLDSRNDNVLARSHEQTSGQGCQVRKIPVKSGLMATLYLCIGIESLLT